MGVGWINGSLLNLWNVQNDANGSVCIKLNEVFDLIMNGLVKKIYRRKTCYLKIVKYILQLKIIDAVIFDIVL